MPVQQWVGNRNEGDSKAPPSSHWRASLVPAAAVIPAPIVYISIVAVKKLVVGSRKFSSSSRKHVSPFAGRRVWGRRGSKFMSSLNGEKWPFIGYLE